LFPPKPAGLSAYNTEKKDATSNNNQKSPPQKQLNYNSPNVKGVISERPSMSGGRYKAANNMVDETMNVSDSSK
jgi:hypothetical protein